MTPMTETSRKWAETHLDLCACGRLKMKRSQRCKHCRAVLAWLGRKKTGRKICELGSYAPS